MTLEHNLSKGQYPSRSSCKSVPFAEPPATVGSGFVGLQEWTVSLVYEVAVAAEVMGKDRISRAEAAESSGDR